MKKKKFIGRVLVCLLAFSLSACTKKSDGESENKEPSVQSEENGLTGEKEEDDQAGKMDVTEENRAHNRGSLKESEEMYEELFDINNFVSVQIEISDKELDKLQQDYIKYDTRNSKSPIYRKADKVTITIEDEVFEIEEVGIRLKGNTSRVPVYDKKTGEPNLSHYKLSFNETFDDKEYYGDDVKVWESEEARQERKERRFATLKEMEIKWNKNYDDTHVREYYANAIFRKAGVLAQNLNLCSLSVNGQNYGVVNIYEPVDKIFIERNLPEEDWGGDLYKCGWTNRPANYMAKTATYGVQNKEEGEFYNYSLKTNKKKSDHSSLRQLLDVFAEKNVTKEAFDSVIDAEYFVRFLAACYFMGDPDDIRNNNNNHYVYFRKSDGKAVFILYDNDRCFGLTHSWNPDGTGMTAMSPYSDKISTGGKQTNPIIKSAILSDGYYVKEYTEELKKIAAFEEWNEENFEQVYEVAKTNYAAVVNPSVTFANVKEEFRFSLEGEYTTGDETNMSFEEYVERLMKTVQEEVK